VLCASQLEH